MRRCPPAVSLFNVLWPLVSHVVVDAAIQENHIAGAPRFGSHAGELVRLNGESSRGKGARQRSRRLYCTRESKIPWLPPTMPVRANETPREVHLLAGV